MPGPVLPEHQAEVEATATPATATRIADDATANRTDECEDAPERQLGIRQLTTETGSQQGPGCHGATTTTTTASQPDEACRDGGQAWPGNSTRCC